MLGNDRHLTAIFVRCSLKSIVEVPPETLMTTPPGDFASLILDKISVLIFGKTLFVRIASTIRAPLSSSVQRLAISCHDIVVIADGTRCSPAMRV